tara:strand:+ start:638 stop:739 length:102 start_codon:yes stop_codon:yes gene_type:complete
MKGEFIGNNGRKKEILWKYYGNKIPNYLQNIKI